MLLVGGVVANCFSFSCYSMMEAFAATLKIAKHRECLEAGKIGGSSLAKFTGQFVKPVR